MFSWIVAQLAGCATEWLNIRSAETLYCWEPARDCANHDLQMQSFSGHLLNNLSRNTLNMSSRSIDKATHLLNTINQLYVSISWSFKPCINPSVNQHTSSTRRWCSQQPFEHWKPKKWHDGWCDVQLMSASVKSVNWSNQLAHQYFQSVNWLIKQLPSWSIYQSIKWFTQVMCATPPPPTSETWRSGSPCGCAACWLKQN